MYIKKKMIDIIVVNYNSTDYLLKCLQTIFDDLGGLSANVFVQDNGSKDGADRIKSLYPQVIFKKNKCNLGFSRAVNQALKQSSAPYIFILNPDTFIEKGFFDSAITYMEDHSDVGVIGPKVLNPDGSIQGSARSFPTPLTSIFGRQSPLTKLFPNNRITVSNILTTKSDGKTPMEVDWVSGACMVVRRKAINEVGLLDERFFMYWEDADWCRRMWEKRWKVIYFPQALIIHLVGASSITRPIRSIYHFHISCYRLYEKYIHWPLSISKPFAFLGLAGRFYIASIFHMVNYRISQHHRLKPAEKLIGNKDKNVKIKVLRIITRLNIGGPAIHVHLLTKGLEIEKFESTLVTGKISPQEGDMTYLSESHSKKPIVIPELQRKISIVKDLRSVVKILKIIHREKPDIVHTHTAKAGFCARIAVFFYNLFSRHKVKTIHTFHGHVFEGYFKNPFSQAFILIERLLSKFTDIIIAISNTQKHELSDKYRIAPAHKIKTIQLGFQLNSFLESNGLEHPFRQRFGIDDNTFLIGIVGRLVPIKNHVMFLNAVKVFLEQNPDVNVKFMVVGDGELRSVLEKYCKEQNLSDHVRFCGWVIDVHLVYADLDILALTSINEGTPVSVIEAMASSVPVIATDVGGITDLLGPANGLSTSNGFQTRERGFLCHSNDAIGFAEGLKYLMENDANKNRQRIIRAKDFVVRNYSHERLLRDMESLYNGLMNRTF
jgi:GT2 family glycosyltransferase/glycosyltransferase involved in cell wall biosynthesis